VLELIRCGGEGRSQGGRDHPILAHLDLRGDVASALTLTLSPGLTRSGVTVPLPPAESVVPSGSPSVTASGSPVSALVTDIRTGACTGAGMPVTVVVPGVFAESPLTTRTIVTTAAAAIKATTIGRMTAARRYHGFLIGGGGGDNWNVGPFSRSVMVSNLLVPTSGIQFPARCQTRQGHQARTEN
jgi:hypothetical protein